MLGARAALVACLKMGASIINRSGRSYLAGERRGSRSGCFPRHVSTVWRREFPLYTQERGQAFHRLPNGTTFWRRNLWLD